MQNPLRKGFIDTLVKNVSLSEIERHIRALSVDIGLRDTTATQVETANYIVDQLMGFGYPVTREPVDSSENVIAKLPGQLNPDKTFVIGAHFDTVPGSPGADDNASAVAGMLEIARVLKELQPDFSIEFVGFALEEEGLRGSCQYAQSAAAQNRDLIGMISLEMIAYTSSTQTPFYNIPSCLSVSEEGRTVGDFIGAVGNDNSATLLNTFQQATTLYVPALLVLTGLVAENGYCFPNTRRSDHAPFWDEGYQALMITDTADFRNTNYHQPTDTLGTLNLNFARQVTQATLATLLQLQPNFQKPTI
jgi:Zn-dependent M28 family amino/carboxypeptidase